MRIPRVQLFIVLMMAVMAGFVACKKEAKPYVDASKKEVVIATAGGSETITLKANVAWKITVPAEVEWLTIDRTVGEAGETALKITVQENPTSTNRTANLTLNAVDAQAPAVTIAVKQQETTLAITAVPTQVAGAQIITIEGKGFSTVLAENTVTVNGKAALVKEAQHNKLKVEVPLKAGEGKIVVKVAAQTAESPVVKYNWVWMTTSLYGAYGAYGITVSDNGTVYTGNFGLHTISKFSPGTSAVLAGSISHVAGFNDNTDGSKALFYYPGGLAMSELGDVLVADINNGVIRQVTPTGSVSTFKTFSKAIYPAVITASADKKLFYVTDWSGRNLVRFDNTGAETHRSFASDDGGMGDIKINGLSLAPNNDLYLTDNAQHRVLKLSNGVLSVVAGGMQGDGDGAGTAAKLYSPFGIAHGNGDTLFIADQNNHKIKMITGGNVVTTIAGSSAGVEDGIGTAAKYKAPTHLHYDKLNGDLYIADNGNDAVRKLTRQ
ncbi:BACON domain-containing carbohydrate-binding protein [Paraflavitalea sp. CAU 1676]|uniref:BACON domain-containing protein n=1 Tax=Paraflavitalea sp. CAU 1676 TaxID=3032598 RepID=UPI0023DAAB40|nr:BACON domain-containing carbohydrate-binding protein [Paraflavitalea sp. CAU 1676]MDF2192352.1 BACON domain-containing carbohydrate-binding protein [Paraflavitalea sp. CAU 1676]